MYGFKLMLRFGFLEVKVGYMYIAMYVHSYLVRVEYLFIIYVCVYLPCSLFMMAVKVHLQYSRLFSRA